MGYPGKNRKSYETPKHPWQAARMASEVELIKRYGLRKTEAVLDDILSLDVTTFLDRRLQTQVHKQGLANSIKQARQFIVHGHISVGDRKVTVPGYIVSIDEELKLGYYGGSPLSGESHPSRPAQVVKEITKEVPAQPDVEIKGG